MAPIKQLHFNFFDMACTATHLGIGQWQTPNDNSSSKDTLEYYIWLAKLAEKGKISSIFFADHYGMVDTYKGNSDAAFKGGDAAAMLDPVVMVSAMAAVTKSVSFGITGSTTYIPPYLLARTWGTLDHMSKGRIAWNVVTSYGSKSAQAVGYDKVTPHDKRYLEAGEYMEIMYSLWEGSWEDGAQTWSSEKGAYDPSKIHKITYNGKYHTTSAFSQSHPSPQRTPVIFQAGASKAGKAFAAHHAEAIFVGGGDPVEIGKMVKEVRALAAKEGRDPQDVKFFPMLTPILGHTLEEAQSKYDTAQRYVDWESGLAMLSDFAGLDLSKFPVDEPIRLGDAVGENNLQTMVNALKSLAKEGMTLKQLGHNFAFLGFGCIPVGTPDMVADVIEDWINIADIDGFNLGYVSNPGSYDDIVELLIPVLQERGIMWKDYAAPGGTFRENLYRTPSSKTLFPSHPGAQFRYDVLKEKYADQNGHIVIDKRKEIDIPAEETTA